MLTQAELGLHPNPRTLQLEWAGIWEVNGTELVFVGLGAGRKRTAGSSSWAGGALVRRSAERETANERKIEAPRRLPHERRQARRLLSSEGELCFGMGGAHRWCLKRWSGGGTIPARLAQSSVLRISPQKN